MASTPTIRQRNERYAQNIHKRGMVKDTLKKAEPEQKEATSTVAPYLAVLFLAIIVGGAIFEILNRRL
ncbi:stress-associated endoplasmic reticulum protein 2-like protein [Entophlyctis helioformis]|nr:stress-associated endoplasmic reticulum protein 2-like protein [Entophlyctis helioformis]